MSFFAVEIVDDDPIVIDGPIPVPEPMVTYSTVEAIARRVAGIWWIGIDLRADPRFTTMTGDPVRFAVAFSEAAARRRIEGTAARFFVRCRRRRARSDAIDQASEHPVVLADPEGVTS